MSRTLILSMSDEDYNRYQDWQECVAFRIEDLGDGTGKLIVTDDLELITRPEPASVPCPACHQTGTVIDSNGRSWRCHRCNGTGVVPAGERADHDES